MAEASTPAKKRSFGFRRSSDQEKKSGGSSKKKSREGFVADASKGLGAEKFSETPKASEATESNQELHQAGKEKGKKHKKKHYRHFSFGGKFHKHKGKDVETPYREINNDTSESSECLGTETSSSATQSSSKTQDADDVKIEEQGTTEPRPQKDDDEATEQTKESGNSATVAEEDEAKSSDPTLNAVPLAEEENFEAEDVTWVQGENRTTTKEQNKQQVVLGQSSQSEGDKIGGQARESEFQMTKDEQAMEIPLSPKETTAEKQSDEGESSHDTADEVGLEFPTAAEDDTTPKSAEAQEQSKKQPDAKEGNTFSPGIGAIYQALLQVKESLMSGEKQSSINKISGIPYEICQLTVDTGRTKLSDLLGFLLGQAGYSTRHVLSYFVKILIQKYPHCFQVKAHGKRKRSKEQRNDGTPLDITC